MDLIKDVVRSSVKVPEFGKHLKKAGEHIGQNVVEITMKTIVRKHLMIKVICHRFCRIFSASRLFQCGIIFFY